MEQFAETLKCNEIDLVWWPLFLGSYRDDATAWEPVKTEAESFDYEETLP
ncbi:MAG TPA: hypothetical protein VEX68_16280 [Bryobacteraceae bacterium]|nr:hypothetical protein [Bryobacteraceae bacterium]